LEECFTLDMAVRRNVLGWGGFIMKARCASALALVLALSTPADALTGDDLLEECEGNAGHEMFCLGFIFGVGEHIGGCWASGTTSRQFRDAAVKYLREHPEERHKRAAGIVSTALIDAFSCEAINRRTLQPPEK
jgi:hypothetical protein